MKSPVGGTWKWLILDEVGSTQDVAHTVLADNSDYDVIFAKEQVAGRGRFDRQWHSQSGASLTFSIVFRQYPDHPAPYLIGMAAAVAVAGSIHCQLQWPNDLTVRGKKVGGIITEMRPTAAGASVPIVGIGINLNQSSFPPEIAHRAVSLFQAFGQTLDAQTVGEKILHRLESLPEPTSWQSFAAAWQLFDDTPGKPYTLPSGEIAQAVAIGSSGELICTVNGETTSVLAADAMFGQDR